MALLAGAIVAAVVAVILTRGTTSDAVRLSASGAASASSSTTLPPPATTAVTAPGPSVTLAAPTTTVPPVTTTLPFTTTPPATLPPASTTLPPATTPPDTLPPATTTLPPATTAPPTSSPTSPPTSAPTPGGVISGTVDDSSGQPVAGAYVIGLDSLTVAQTDASGQFTMSCLLTANGISGNRAEPLVASAWLLPVQPSGQGSYAFGRNTTIYGPPPTAAGLGYMFSGGSLDAANAAIVSCGGPPPHFVLGTGGGVDIEFVDSSGAPLADNAATVPVDNLYLPGLGDHAALETAPLSGGHQVVQQLGAGSLQIDGTTTTLSCQGPGVVPDPGVAGADVTITPGMTTKVICTA
jgi:hypothetical protein